ncbi:MULTISPECIES: phage tail tip lysozyme [unclassified Kribbella]|uniref:phage tail tip lysozyme n=1 Tax=unclassified Kribbella TaxID=2644121 RepID=UPI0030776440
MGDSKALPIAGGVMLVLFLPLLIVLALIAGGLAGLETAAADCTPTQTEGKAFAWPTDRHEVDQGWSEGGGRGQSPHHGIDFEIEAGKNVYAAEDGEVVSTSDNQVRIKHDAGVETRYKYFQDIKVNVGQQVKRGQQIGTVGSGNEATPGLSGDHLHFELWIEKEDGKPLEAVDPKNDSFGEDTEETGSGSCGCSDLVGSNNQQKAFNYFVSNGYSKEQSAGIVGNMIHESGVEPGRLQNTPPGKVTNPSDAVDSSLGWGIVQWTPAGKMIRPSREAGVDDAVIGSLEYQLEFLKKQLAGETAIPEKNAGDMVKGTTSAADAAVAFGRYYERFAGSEDLSNPRYTQRKTAATEVLSTFGGGATTDGTGGGCGAGNGDIVKTALQLAWDTPNHGFDPKPGYREAQKEYNGSTGYNELTDCGVFVATVMVMSGVDKDYARRGTTIQREYVRNSSKYQVFENLTNEGQLKPGDIFVHSGHTFIYTGNYKGGDGKTYNAASASLNGHVPEATHVYFSDSRGHYTVARIRQSGASD